MTSVLWTSHSEAKCASIRHWLRRALVRISAQKGWLVTRQRDRVKDGGEAVAELSKAPLLRENKRKPKRSQDRPLSIKNWFLQLFWLVWNFSHFDSFRFLISAPDRVLTSFFPTSAFEGRWRQAKRAKAAHSLCRIAKHVRIFDIGIDIGFGTCIGINMTRG